MKKRLLSIALALSLIAPVCASPTAEAYNDRRIEEPLVLSTNGLHSGLVTVDGTLWMWGRNSRGCVGDGSDTDRWSPVKVMTDIKTVATSYDNTAALKKDGSLWVWGYCSYLTTDEDVDCYYKPVKFMDKVSDVVPSEGGYYVIKKDGSLWVMGDCYWIVAQTPRKILDDVRSVAPGETHGAAIKEDGSLWMWGYNYSGELGDGTKENRKTPVKVLDNVKSVSLGDTYSAAIKEDGSLWMWGDNYAGRLGTGTWDDSIVPIKVMDSVTAVFTGEDYTAAIKEDGSLWTWGDNDYGQLGDGTTEARRSPVKVMDDVKDVYLDWRTSAAIKTDGSLWMWGSNYYGQVGDGTTQDRLAPKKVLDSVASVSVGYYNAMAIKEDRTVWVWGVADGLGLGENFKGYKTCYDFRGDPMGQYVGTPTQLTGIPAVPQCTVTLNLNGGDGATKLTCDKNGTITPPNNPSRDGYFFAGWYKDKACKKPWNFDTDKVTGNCTLYAKWEPKSTTTVTAEPSTQKVEIDGKKIVLNSYVLRNDQGYPVNFVKLRDIAYLLNGTEANFNVDWRNNAIRLDARQPYTTPNGAEMTVPTVAAAPTKTSITPVLTGGVTAPLEAFLLTDKNGGGHNYFKLRDIGKVAGFNVEWDAERSLIVVTTTEDYIG